MQYIFNVYMVSSTNIIHYLGTFTYIAKHADRHLINYMYAFCSGTNDAQYKEPKPLDQLQNNPSYMIKATTSDTKGEIEDKDYEICDM